MHEQRLQIVHALDSPSAALFPRPVLPRHTQSGAKRRMKLRPARRQHFYIAPTRLLRTRLLPFRSPGEASPGPAQEEDSEGGSEHCVCPTSWTHQAKRILLPWGPGWAPVGGHQGSGAPRAKLNNLQLLQALRARRVPDRPLCFSGAHLAPPRQNTLRVGKCSELPLLSRSDSEEGSIRSLANNSPRSL